MVWRRTTRPRRCGGRDLSRWRGQGVVWPRKSSTKKGGAEASRADDRGDGCDGQQIEGGRCPRGGALARRPHHPHPRLPAGAAAAVRSQGRRGARAWRDAQRLPVVVAVVGRPPREKDRVPRDGRMLQKQGAFGVAAAGLNCRLVSVLCAWRWDAAGTDSRRPGGNHRLGPALPGLPCAAPAAHEVCVCGGDVRWTEKRPEARKGSSLLRRGSGG